MLFLSKQIGTLSHLSWFWLITVWDIYKRSGGPEAFAAVCFSRIVIIDFCKCSGQRQTKDIHLLYQVSISATTSPLLVSTFLVRCLPGLHFRASSLDGFPGPECRESPQSITDSAPLMCRRLQGCDVILGIKIVGMSRSSSSDNCIGRHVMHNRVGWWLAF